VVCATAAPDVSQSDHNRRIHLTRRLGPAGIRAAKSIGLASKKGNRNPRAVEHERVAWRDPARISGSVRRSAFTPMPRFARPDTRTVYLRYRAVWGMLPESLEAVVAEAG
jgi:hypothetical protein